jgi:HD-GYP domain-containing protein (c-di-GMP phosphodiesterase class II)
MTRDRLSPMFAKSGPMKALALSMIAANSSTDFDVFLMVGGIPVLYGPSPYRWSKSEISRLQAEGHATIYYSNAEAAKADVYVSLNGIKSVDISLPPVKRIRQITDVTAEFTRVLFNQKLTQTAVSRAVSIVDTMRSCLEEDPTCVHTLSSLAAHCQDSYLHSGRVAAYAIALALELGERRSDRLIEIGLGCLLHDIGNNKMRPELLDKEGPLSPSEWSELHRHPELGHAQIAHAVLSGVPREIVLHHHERQDGSGYPHQLSKDQIIPEVRIAAIADVFDGLTSLRPHRRPRTAYQALDFMKYSMAGALDPEAFSALVEILGRSPLKKAA